MIIPANRVSVKDKEQILKEIEHLLSTGMYAYGQFVSKFEHAFAEYVGTKYAVMTNSGTTAIELAVRFWYEKWLGRPNMGILPTILPSNTYMATYNAVENAMRHPMVRFLGCNKDLAMNIEGLVKNHQLSYLILYTHIGGNISQTFGELLDFIKDSDITLIVDDCHSLGCTHNGKRAGSFGLAGCFSLFPTKIVHCGGEGGVLTTNNRELYEYAMSYRHHGRDDWCIESRDKVAYAHVQEGSNYKPSEISAIIALANLKRLPEYIKHRKKIIELYRQKVDILGNKGSNGYKAVTYQVKGFKDKQISFSGSVFKTPLHKQPYLRSYYDNGTFKETEKYCSEHRCLPLYNDMTIEEAEYVLKNIEVK